MNFYTNVKVYGNNILYRGIENGRKIRFQYEYNPTLYVPTNKKSDWTTISGKYVEPMQQGSIKQAKEFIKKYDEVDNFEIYGDIGFDVQYIAEKFPDLIDWDINKVSIQFIDIETTSENGFPDPHEASESVLLISVTDLCSKQTKTFTTTPYSKRSIKDVDIVLCDTEKSMLIQFISYLHDIQVDVISGWHINGFDIPFLINRIERVLGEGKSKNLSPWNRINSRTVSDNFGNDTISYEILGIEILDYMDLYKKFTYQKREQYTLDFICQEELGVGKLDHSEYASFKEFYTKDFDKFLEYNVIDTQRVLQLEEKMKLIELCLTMGYLAKINYTDVFSQIRMWDAIIYNYLLSNKLVIPPRSSSSKSEKFEGAYVMEPKPGFYEWVVSFDATSLYPSIIQTWNISPETFVGLTDYHIDVDKMINEEYNLQSDYATAANGAMYRKDKKGIMPELIDVYMKKRKDAKNSMLAKQSELEHIKEELKRRGLY